MNWPRPVKDAVFYILWIIGQILRLFFFKITIKGLDHVPRNDSYLLVSNHQSYIDPVALHLVSRRRLNFLMAAEYYYDRRWKWFYDLFGCVPLEKDRANPKAVERAIMTLRKGEPLVMFPEGYISEDGKLGEWLPGVGMMALRSGSPVIPVLIWGTHDVLPMDRWIPQLKPIAIYVGESFILKPKGRSLSRNDVNDANQKIREAFLQLARENGLYENLVRKDE